MQATNSVNGAARIGAEANGGRASSWHNGRGWTPAEIEELLNLSSTQTIRTIARRLGRTEKSVRRKLEQMGRTQELLTGFKTKDLARDLQVSVRQVRRWRARGYLDCVAGRITEESFEKFCRNHPEKIPYRQLSREMQLWLDGYGYPAGQGLRVSELASMLHVSPKTVRRWIGLGWLQAGRGRISEESFARLHRQHPELIRFEELSSETREMLARLMLPTAPTVRESIRLESRSAFGV
jgi:DNA-binding CsgD family transcriptional regulator